MDPCRGASVTNSGAALQIIDSEQTTLGEHWATFQVGSSFLIPARRILHDSTFPRHVNSEIILVTQLVHGSVAGMGSNIRNATLKRRERQREFYHPASTDAHHQQLCDSGANIWPLHLHPPSTLVGTSTITYRRWF